CPQRACRSTERSSRAVPRERRTPSKPPFGWTHTQDDSAADAGMTRRAVQVIARNARAQEQLISDLLDVSRIISGKLRLDVHDVDLIAFINAAIETTRPAAEARRIAVDCTLDPSLAPTTGDPTRLQQCVLNLPSDAIKFPPHGGRVSVVLRRDDSHVAIVVKDSGVGIRADFLPLVFERFRQAESEPSKRSGGLGLGLAIVKQLVELHGGRATVES